MRLFSSQHNFSFLIRIKYLIWELSHFCLKPGEPRLSKHQTTILILYNFFNFEIVLCKLQISFGMCVIFLNSIDITFIVANN